MKIYYFVLIIIFEILFYKYKNYKVKKVYVSINYLYVNICILIKLLLVGIDNDVDDIEF